MPMADCTGTAKHRVKWLWLRRHPKRSEKRAALNPSICRLNLDPSMRQSPERLGPTWHSPTADSMCATGIASGAMTSRIGAWRQSHAAKHCRAGLDETVIQLDNTAALPIDLPTSPNPFSAVIFEHIEKLKKDYTDK